MALHIYDSPASCEEGLAKFIIDCSRSAIASKGRFDIVLSGGNSPKKLFARLATKEYREQLDLAKIFFFFADERYLPFDDPNNNGKMVYENFFLPAKVPQDNIFIMDTSLPPAEAAMDYWNKLLNHFDRQPPVFDLVLLGLGDNSHTASLFPHSAILDARLPGVEAVWVEEVKMFRITLNAPLINLARNVAFFVYGKDKAKAVHHILRGPRSHAQHPAQLIHPSAGQLHWFLDKEAASMVESN